MSRLVSLRLDQLISFFAHGVEVSLTSPTKGTPFYLSSKRFCEHFTLFFQRETDASMPPLTLEQLWHALKGTSSFVSDAFFGYYNSRDTAFALQTEKLKNIVTTLIEMLIDPIAVMVFQLPRNRVITSRVTKNKQAPRLFKTIYVKPFDAFNLMRRRSQQEEKA